MRDTTLKGFTMETLIKQFSCYFINSQNHYNDLVINIAINKIIYFLLKCRDMIICID